MGPDGVAYNPRARLVNAFSFEVDTGILRAPYALPAAAMRYQ